MAPSQTSASKTMPSFRKIFDQSDITISRQNWTFFGQNWHILTKIHFRVKKDVLSSKMTFFAKIDISGQNEIWRITSLMWKLGQYVLMFKINRMFYAQNGWHLGVEMSRNVTFRNIPSRNVIPVVGCQDLVRLTLALLISSIVWVRSKACRVNFGLLTFMRVLKPGVGKRNK